MALELSGSINISGSMTATTIVVSSPGVAGMVSSSAQIGELVPLMQSTSSINNLTGSLITTSSNNVIAIDGLNTYTASLKGAAIVSSSQQITNYYKFAETASANTFYNTSSFLGITGMGTSTPLSLLHIASGDTDQGIRLTRANGTYGIRITRTGLLQGKLSDDTTFQTAIELTEGNSSANNYLRLQPTAGAVGIGPLNIAPDTKLHISGSDGIKIQAGGNADTPGLTIINYTNQYGWAKFGGGLQGNGNGYAIISCWNGASVSEKVRVSGDGYLRLAGTGIQFNGDTADANSLDDYEEGTWTPTISFNGNAAGLTYNTQYGVYTKIGNVVHFSFRLILSAKGSSTGGASLAGLPFTSANTNGNFGAVPVAFADAVSSFDKTLTWIVDPNATTIALRYCNGTNYANLDDTNFTNSSNIIASGTYRTA